MTTVLLHTGQTAPILEPRQPEMRVVRGGKHGLNRARQFAAVALHVIAAALLLGLIFSVVHSQARITELNGQINDTRTGLTAAQSEYDYLSTKMSDITSRASLQDVAEGQLGLVKADQSQITYIRLGESDTLERTQSAVRQWTDFIYNGAVNILGTVK